MKMVFWQFARNNAYISIPRKMSEVHLHAAWLFSNPCGKVLIIVGIPWNPDLRVKHIHLKKLNYQNIPFNWSLADKNLRIEVSDPKSYWDWYSNRPFK